MKPIKLVTRHIKRRRGDVERKRLSQTQHCFLCGAVLKLSKDYRCEWLMGPETSKSLGHKEPIKFVYLLCAGCHSQPNYTAVVEATILSQYGCECEIDGEEHALFKLPVVN